MSDVLIPGLLIAAEICDQFAIVNTHIVKDEIDQLCQTDAWTKVENHEQAHDHAKKAEAASEIGAFLRKMVVEKGGEV